MGNTSVYFDENGNPPIGYDIICWIWRGRQWSLRKVGSFSSDPITLTVNADLIEWNHTGDSEVRKTFLSAQVFSILLRQSK